MRQPDPTMIDTGKELAALIKAYAKQETVDPLKAMGRFVAFGLMGSLLLSLGVTLLLLSLLRALQTETDTTFTGNLSWLPYLIVVAVAGGVIALAVAAISRKEQA